MQDTDFLMWPKPFNCIVSLIDRQHIPGMNLHLTFFIYSLYFSPNFLIRSSSSFKAVMISSAENKRATIIGNALFHQREKPIYVRIIPKYPGCLIFEYIPLVMILSILSVVECDFLWYLWEIAWIINPKPNIKTPQIVTNIVEPRGIIERLYPQNPVAIKIDHSITPRRLGFIKRYLSRSLLCVPITFDENTKINVF